MTKLLVVEETKSKLRTNPFTDRDWLARRRPAVILVCNDKDVVADTFHKPGPSSLVSGELPMNFGCEITVGLADDAQCRRVSQSLQLKKPQDCERSLSAPGHAETGCRLTFL